MPSSSKKQIDMVSMNISFSESIKFQFSSNPYHLYQMLTFIIQWVFWEDQHSLTSSSYMCGVLLVHDEFSVYQL